MTINEFIHKLGIENDRHIKDPEHDNEKISDGPDNGELWYLSTQQPESEDDTESASKVDKPTRAFRTSPCRELFNAKLLESTLPWAGNLKLESCNLWMGKSQNGSSSGLHHDYHDNFYSVLRGRKQFEILSPDVAPFMETYGTIDRIYFNGVISYKGSETRPDGVPLDWDDNDGVDDQGGNNDVDDRNEDDDGDDDEEEEEEVVLGKGFDYHDSDDGEGDEEEDIDFEAVAANGRDDFDEIFADDEAAKNDQTNSADKEAATALTTTDRPNSFSKIDLTTIKAQEDLKKKGLKRVVITLEPGDILYLPAGFFHCVTSFSPDVEQIKAKTDEKLNNNIYPATTSCHMAINYWYHPPDRLDSFDCPYTHPDDLPS